MKAVDLLVDVLATRRLVRLVVEDEIAHPVRVWAAKTDPRLEYLVGCPSCSSVWAAAAVTLAPKPVKLALAASEGAIMLGTIVRSLERAML